MNPVLFEIGSISIRSYAAWLGGSLLIALAIIGWRAYRFDPGAVMPWLDVGIAACAAGVIGARLLHVTLEWDYFAHHRNEIDEIALGGLAWHGALLTGIPAALLVAWLRRVPLRPWTDAAALAFPVILIGAWLGCRQNGCGYGCEVRTMADFPGWLVEELPDVYGLVAPRLDLQLGGAFFGGLLLILALLLTGLNWLPGLRLWLVLGLGGLGLSILGFFRADPAQTIYHRRADQIFDLLTLLGSTLVGCTLWLLDRRSKRDLIRRMTPYPPLDSHIAEESPDETDPGTGPVHAETG